MLPSWPSSLKPASCIDFLTQMLFMPGNLMLPKLGVTGDIDCPLYILCIENGHYDNVCNMAVEAQCSGTCEPMRYSDIVLVLLARRSGLT